MKDVINVKWAGDMAFEAAIEEHRILFDASPEVGGKNAGPRPKPMLMASLGWLHRNGCDLHFEKNEGGSYRIQCKGEGTLTDEHPKHFTCHASDL